MSRDCDRADTHLPYAKGIDWISLSELGDLNDMNSVSCDGMYKTAISFFIVPVLSNNFQIL